MKAGTIAACFVSVALAAVAEPSPKAQPESVAIGSRLELFVDGNLIESLKGVRLKLHPPRPAERVLFFNREWEGGNSGYVTVFQDGGRYRMYYRGASSTGYAVPSLSTERETAVPEHPQVACTAESPDGITWSRPSLGLFEFNGSKDNNIVWTGSGGHNFSPFKDTNPDATPEQRYKAVGSGRVDGKPVLLGYVSPDGIRWKRLREEPILSDGKFDSLNVAFWDSVRSRYAAFYRDFRHGVRTIKHATSPNFLDWTPGQWGDFGDTPPEHLYTNGTVAYFRAPHLFLALPRRFLPWRKLYPDAPVPGASDGVFMSSRDGVHWDRRFLESFIRPGRDPRNWPQRTNTPARDIVATAEDEISLYVERHRSSPTNHLQRLVLRTDGVRLGPRRLFRRRDDHQTASLRWGQPGPQLLHLGRRQHPDRDSGRPRPPITWVLPGGVAADLGGRDRAPGPVGANSSPGDLGKASGPSRREAGAAAPRDEGRGSLLSEIPIAGRAAALPPPPGLKGSR